MPACVTAFHVTCAFDHNLDMRTILADNDEVKFKSFCLEHSTGATKLPEEARTEPDQAQLDLEKVTLRKQKLQQLEEDFYELVKPSEVAENLDLSESLVDFVYQYWKLKRKANSNKPLLTPKTDEVDNLAQQEQDVLYRRLKLFMHLRQDLERVSTAFPSAGYPYAPSGLLSGVLVPVDSTSPTQFDSPSSCVPSSRALLGGPAVLSVRASSLPKPILMKEVSGGLSWGFKREMSVGRGASAEPGGREADDAAPLSF